MIQGFFPIVGLAVLTRFTARPASTPTPTLVAVQWTSQPAPDPSPVRDKCRDEALNSTVAFEAHLLSSGTVGEIRVLRGSGCAAGDSVLVETVRKWTFKPARQEGAPVSVWLTMTSIIFGDGHDERAA